MEEINISSTSRSSANADPIVLRLKDTVRLVFIPTIVENKEDPDACVKGIFVYQKKIKKDHWENIKEISLNSLKPAEGVQLEIKSAELLHLMKKLGSLWRIHKSGGVPRGRSRFVRISDTVAELDGLSDVELREHFQINASAGIALFKRLADWLSAIEDKEQALASLESLGAGSLRQLNIIVGLESLRRSLLIWQQSHANADEEFWQREFLKNSFLLSQVFAYPILLVKDKAYVGGKSFENSGGNIVDFLCKNELTNNAVLIEIKTPMTQLIGANYRGSVYSVSPELAGAVIQVANYASSLVLSYNSLTSGRAGIFESFRPRSVVIVGNAKRELDDIDKRKSFELFRSGLKDVEVITYDELYGKAKGFVSLLENGQVDRDTRND